MSLNRLIYYSAIIGGWSAFLGWMVSEVVLGRMGEGGGRVVVILSCALVGAAIGAGLNLVAGMANGRLKEQIKRVVPGLLAGGVGGAVGGFIGDVLYGTFELPRAFGWMLMGAGIGVVEGLYERSPAKLRNGLIGGSVGGLVGGFLFDPIRGAIGSQSGMSSRATAFVILGMCIGLLIGLVKVVLKQAWLTVLDGYRPGRQLILSEARIVLGRAEYAALPFMGPNDGELGQEHALVVREPGGRFVLEDKNTRQGTSVNNTRVNGRVILHDNDVIRMGEYDPVQRASPPCGRRGRINGQGGGGFGPAAGHRDAALSDAAGPRRRRGCERRQGPAGPAPPPTAAPRPAPAPQPTTRVTSPAGVAPGAPVTKPGAVPRHLGSRAPRAQPKPATAAHSPGLTVCAETGTRRHDHMPERTSRAQDAALLHPV